MIVGSRYDCPPLLRMPRAAPPASPGRFASSQPREGSDALSPALGDDRVRCLSDPTHENSRPELNRNGATRRRPMLVTLAADLQARPDAGHSVRLSQGKV